MRYFVSLTLEAVADHSYSHARSAHSVLPDDPAERQRFIDDIGGKIAVKEEETGDEADQSYNDEEIALVQTADKHNDLSRIKIMLQGRQDVSGSTPQDSPETSSSLSPPTDAGSSTHHPDPVAFLGNSSTIHLVHGLEKMGGKGEVMKSMIDSMRPEFWKNPTTIMEDRLDPARDAAELEDTMTAWPEPDLEKKLVDAYFRRAHHDNPILNEVTFRAELQDRSLRLDREFVMVAMMVFAVASRLIDDERVLCTPRSDDFLINTLGAKWHNSWKRLAFGTRGPSGSLRYIQSFVLAVVYLCGTGLHFNIGWCLLGVVFRLLEFAGAHRKLTAQRLQHPLAIEEEWRRTWWTAYSLDREISTTLGRPMAVQDEDFDVALPLEVDERYFTASGDGAVPTQPKGKPALISGFLSALKLDEIMGRTLRTIYAIGKAKVSRGLVGKGWDQLIVAEIDSLLNQWLDSVPKHLRYNANEKNEEWLVQSSMLYCKYYFCQILVHRPFIVGPKMSSSLNYPSLAITTNAAKSMTQILGNLLKRGLIHEGGHGAGSRAFEAGCVLLVVVWGSKKNGIRVSNSTFSDINKCLEILREFEKRWAIAGRLNDILSTLCRIFKVETAQQEEEQAVLSKRKASAGDEAGNAAATAHGAPAAPSERPVRGHSRVDNSSSGSLTNGHNHAQPSRSGSGHLDQLPLSTQDLGITPTSDSSGSGSISTFTSPNTRSARAGQQGSGMFSNGNAATTGASNADYSDLAAATAAAAASGFDVSSTGNNGGFDMSALGGSGDLFANFVNGLSAPTFTPLDLPSFSSAFFTQPPTGATPGSTRRESSLFAGGWPNGAPAAGNRAGATAGEDAGGQSMPQLTPGYSSIFGSGVDYNTFQPAASDGQMHQHQQQAGIQPGSTMNVDGNAGGDPFNMRDLWPAGEYGQHH